MSGRMSASRGSKSRLIGMGVRLLQDTFLYLGVIAIGMMVTLSACARNGDGTMAKKVTAIEVYGDPAVAQLADAAAKGNKRVIQALVRQGVDVNARGDQNTSLLEWAFLHRSIDGMLALLEAGADPAMADDDGETIMHFAAWAEDPKAMEALLAAAVSPDLRNPKNGQTPLFTAIMADREPQFRALIAAGADVNAEDLEGERPIHQAAMINNLERVLVLLEAGADPRAVTGRGTTIQTYMNRMQDSARSQRGRERKARVEAWLVEQGVELERETRDKP
ncbi:hypothetical protein AXE65_08440 [Ventosimonas gracilis]|uniref:Uncharacterized protein n=2 Tax=Ventosimonas gracilis TaxID=1680762 RepID=A0A139SY79_9GAMM|nr:hypothetical protein AXE65_08440 [Ventosimonas gracilis]